MVESKLQAPLSPFHIFCYRISNQDISNPSNIIHNESGISFLPSDEICNSYTVSRDNSTADIFDLAEIVGGIEDRVSGKTEKRAIGGGGNLDTKTCDTLTTADSRKPLGLSTFQGPSLEWDNTSDFSNLTNPAMVTSSTFTTQAIDSKLDSGNKPGHPNIGRLDNIGNSNLFTTISPKRGHPGLGKSEPPVLKGINLTSDLDIKGGKYMEELEHESQLIGKESSTFPKNQPSFGNERMLGSVPLGSVPGQGLYDPGLTSLGDMSKLNSRNIIGYEEKNGSRKDLASGVSSSLPFYQMTDDHLYMESSQGLTLSSKENEMEDPKCAVTLQNVMLGDHKSICSEIGGGGGPWRDILEEMAGNLSGEFGVATSDVFDGSSDLRNMDDGVSKSGGILPEKMENVMDGPKSFEMKPKGKRRDFELEAALQNLTSDEVEQRRIRMFGEEPLTYHGSRLERGDSITSNGFDSPGT